MSKLIDMQVLCPGPLINRILPVSDSLAHVGVTASVFLTLAITLERHTAVCQPLTYQVQNNALILTGPTF